MKKKLIKIYIIYSLNYLLKIKLCHILSNNFNLYYFSLGVTLWGLPSPKLFRRPKNAISKSSITSNKLSANPPSSKPSELLKFYKSSSRESTYFWTSTHNSSLNLTNITMQPNSDWTKLWCSNFRLKFSNLLSRKLKWNKNSKCSPLLKDN